MIPDDFFPRRARWSQLSVWLQRHGGSATERHPLVSALALYAAVVLVMLLAAALISVDMPFAEVPARL